MGILDRKKKDPKPDKKKKGEPEVQEEKQPDIPEPTPEPTPEPVAPVEPGVPVGSILDGTKFWLDGELYRKDLGPSRGQIVGTRYYKTATTGDTWIASTENIKLEPDVRVEPY